MQGVKSATPLAEYVRALIAARFKQAAELFSHLPNACNDPKLRSRAASEPDFDSYKHDERFGSAVNR